MLDINKNPLNLKNPFIWNELIKRLYFFKKIINTNRYCAAFLKKSNKDILKITTTGTLFLIFKKNKKFKIKKIYISSSNIVCNYLYNIDIENLEFLIIKTIPNNSVYDCLIYFWKADQKYINEKITNMSFKSKKFIDELLEGE
jgi:hypothetical protein